MSESGFGYMSRGRNVLWEDGPLHYARILLIFTDQPTYDVLIPIMAKHPAISNHRIAAAMFSVPFLCFRPWLADIIQKD